MIPRASERAEKDFLEHGLTTRETNAVRSTLAGMTAAEAATEMGVGASTVGSLRRNAYQKLGATSGRELVQRYAEKNDDGPEWGEALRNHGLNRTQADVLALVASGLSTAQIAEELHVAPGTVRAARANGYRMLGVHSHHELVELLDQTVSEGVPLDEPGISATKKGAVEKDANERQPPATRQRQLSRRGFLLGGAIVASFAVIALGVAHFAPGDAEVRANDTVSTPYGDMPRVVGMNVHDAWGTLAESGFLPQIASASDEDSPPGTVISQEALELPVGTVASAMDAGGVTHEEYSSGHWVAAARITVADVIQIPQYVTHRQTIAEITQALRELGIKHVSISYEDDSTGSSRIVKELSPPPGAWVTPDEEVRLTATNTVEMPNILGMGPVEASATLLNVGLAPSENVIGYKTSEETGWSRPLVVSCSVPVGEMVEVGTLVQVEYSEPLVGATFG